MLVLKLITEDVLPHIGYIGVAEFVEHMYRLLDVLTNLVGYLIFM
jgi:hypothetical protein